MSSKKREQLIARFNDEVRMQQNAVDRLDEAACEFMGISRTEARCLDVIDRRGRVAAGELAEETGLTTGAITGLLDRLERKGFIRRLPDPTDRRRVLVEAEPARMAQAMKIYGPIGAEGNALIAPWSDAQIEQITEFLAAGRELLVRHAERVREMTKAKAAGKQKRRPAGAARS